ncbi:Variable major outer membrane lipoprotein (plasmid) [Borrelia crocidurae DOU]|uniref:Variable large protein n=1 Tax=Borrelia crocidurae DOU TaxID=1293575 RepID=W5SLA6_9SPIR|nr:Variable major outer membrane lipoprotein [Borrelia crocidurae DOU]
MKGEGQVGGATGGEGRGLSGAMMEVGRSAENVFYSFLGLIADTLGFTAKATTKKSEVGEYFSGLGAKLGEASAELEKVASKASAGVDKDGVFDKAIKTAVDTAKITLSTLKGHLESLKGIGDSSLVGEVKSDNKQGVAAGTEELKIVYKALKGIVDTAVELGVDKLKESAITLANGTIGVNDAKNGAKVLATGAAAGSAVGDKAALIVSSVRGEEMLASIVKSAEGDAAGTISENVSGTTSALKFARGGNDASHLAQDAALAGAVSGGIALRSLVKGGKLAAKDNNDDKAVQRAGITAVNKLLVAVEGIVKKTVKNVLEKVKQEVDKAREPKASGKQ